MLPTVIIGPLICFAIGWCPHPPPAFEFTTAFMEGFIAGQPTPTTTTVPAQPRPRAKPPSSSSVHRGLGSNVEQWRSLVAAYFPANQVDRALCVMSFESGGNPNAQSSSDARGLMQVLAGLWAPHFGIDPAALYDPDTNIRIAAAIYSTQGWMAWNPYKRGECR